MQKEFASQASVSTTVQQTPLSDRLRSHLPQRWCDDARRDKRNRRRNVAGQDRFDHRTVAVGTLSMETCPTNLYPQKGWCDPNPLNWPKKPGDEERHLSLKDADN